MTLKPGPVDEKPDFTYQTGMDEISSQDSVLGSGKTRCFQMIEVELYFAPDRQLVSRYITGGEFITREEFEARE